MAIAPFLVSAIGTPLDGDECLQIDDLDRHLSEQWEHGMNSVLVGGTMGVMQLLRDRTFEELVDAAASSERQGELLLGVGDASLARVKDRIAITNRYRVNGVVALCPYFFDFTQKEVSDHFLELADASTHPVFLYDVPSLTGTALEIDTILKLAEHPNIVGMKAAGDIGVTCELLRVVPPDFRVIVAQATMVCDLLRQGVSSHLDGIFALAPGWVAELGRSASNEDWERAASYQSRISELLEVIVERYPVFAAFTEVMRARGYDASFGPRPFRQLTSSERSQLLSEPIVVELIDQMQFNVKPNFVVKRQA